MESDTLIQTATIENLDTVIEFVEERADRCCLEAKKKYGLLVAIEEAFVNVCHYAYPDGNGEVELTCDCAENSFAIEIADRGMPFDVLSLPDPDTTADILEREVGGLGVYFIRKMTDEVSYRREDGRNILRVVLYRNGGGGT